MLLNRNFHGPTLSSDMGGSILEHIVTKEWSVPLCLVYLASFWYRGEAEGVPSVRRHQELTPCQMDTVPASSKMDSPLAKAALIKVGHSPLIFKKGQNPQQQLWDKSEKTRKKKTAVTKTWEGGVGEGAAGTRAGIPLQPVEKTVMTQVDLMQHINHVKADIHTAAKNPMPEQVVMPWRKLPPVERLHWSRFAGSIYDPVGNPC